MKDYLKAISKRKLNLKLIALVIFCMSNFLATTNLCFADDRQNGKFIQISAGKEHAVALRDDGTVWAWGRGTEGQLGNGNFKNSATFVQVAGLENITKVVAGGYHNLAIDESGNVWSWGSSDNGQLGIGTHIARATPQKIDYSNLTQQSAIDISAGEKHSIILTSEEVLGFGRNAEGQLGTMSFGTEKQRPGVINGYSAKDEKHTFAISAGGNTTSFIQPNSNKEIFADIEIAACGEDISEFVSNIARVYTGFYSCKSISSYDKNIAVLYPDAKIEIYGDGVLNGDSLENVNSVSMGNDFIIVAAKDGSAYTWGNAFYSKSYMQGDVSVNDKETKIPVENVVDVAAGYDFGLLLDKKGVIWGLGKNNYGQLGDGTTKNAEKPVKTLSIDFVMNETVSEISAGYKHTLAIKKDGTVWAWGNNQYGQLGNGNNIDSFVPVQVKGLTDVVEVSAGYDFSIARKKDGTVWAWGNNQYGQLGNGTTKQSYLPTKVKLDVTAKSITAGYDHCGIVADDETAWTWGNNKYGQLGDKSYVSRNVPVMISLTCVKKMSAGNGYTMLLKRSGMLYTFGKNDCGQLGAIKTYNNKPMSIMLQVEDMSAGESHALALKNDGTVYTCGYNINNSLALGTTGNQIDIIQIPGLEDIASIEAGKNANYATTKDGTILFWGDYNSCLNSGGSVYSKNKYVSILNISDVKYISAGSGYQLYKKTDDTIWTFGFNDYGQLGDGTTKNSTSPQLVNWNGNPNLFPINGRGIENDPYLIYNVDDFNKIGNNLSAYYKLMNDLDFNYASIMPIGDESNPFKGSFDGNNKMLSNLKIEFANIENVGLFGCTESATIKNLCIANAKVLGKTNVGILVGKMIGGSITNCMIEISGGNEIVGLTEGNVNISDNNLIEKSEISGFEKSIKIEKGKNQKIMLTVENLPFVKSMIYKVIYEATKVKPISIGNNVDEKTNTLATDKNVEVIYNKDGEIHFKINSSEKNYTGVLTEILFNCLETGESTIKFEIE